MDGTKSKRSTGAPAGEGRAAAGDDTALIAACWRFVAAEAEYRRRILLPGGDSTSRGFKRWSRRNYDPAITAVCDTPARKMAGSQAKALCVVRFYEPDPPEQDSALSSAAWEVLCEMADFGALVVQPGTRRPARSVRKARASRTG